jgi:hypothetical protein
MQRHRSSSTTGCSSDEVRHVMTTAVAVFSGEDVVRRGLWRWRDERISNMVG